MIEEGELTPESAANHPLRNMLTRVLGTREALEKVDTGIVSRPRGPVPAVLRRTSQHDVSEDDHCHFEKPNRSQKIGGEIAANGPTKRRQGQCHHHCHPHMIFWISLKHKRRNGAVFFEYNRL